MTRCHPGRSSDFAEAPPSHYHVDQLVSFSVASASQLDALRRDAEAGVGLLLGGDPDVADLRRGWCWRCGCCSCLEGNLATMLVKASERIIDRRQSRRLLGWTSKQPLCYCQAVSYGRFTPWPPEPWRPTSLSDKTLNVALGAELRRRIDAAADRYGCAAGMVARYAIEHGMRGALQRLQRELPPDQRPSTAPEAPETAERG